MLSCFISGLTGGLIFQQDWGGLFSFVALIPFFYALVSLQGKRWWGGMLLFSFLWSYLGIWWLNTLVVFHGLVPLGVVAGGFYLAAFVMIFAIAAKNILPRISPAHWIWILPLLWTGQEFLRNLGDMAFPWNLMGHALAPFPSLIQTAALVGVYGVSFLVVGVNAALFVYFYNKFVLKDTTHKKPLQMSLLEMGLLVLTAMFVWSPVEKSRREAAAEEKVRISAEGEVLRVAAGQGNVSQLDKWNAAMGLPDDTRETYDARYTTMDHAMQQSAVNLINKITSATVEQNKPVHLILLPESVFLSPYFSMQSDLQNGMAKLAAGAGADIVFGADNQIEKDLYKTVFKTGSLDGKEKTFPLAWPRQSMPTTVNDAGTTVVDQQKLQNLVMMVSAWQAKSDNTINSAIYNKRQLVPFGEMTPFVSGIPWLANFLESSGIAGACVPGFEPTIFQTGHSKYGTMICFESSFSYLARDLARNNADFLTVITNDAWYNPRYAKEQGGVWGALFSAPGFSRIVAAGPPQHLAQSVYRSVETNRALVRSANSGISAVIAPSGVIRQRLPYDSDGILTDTIPLVKKQTAYTLYGNIFAWVCAAVLGGVYAWMIGRNFIRKNADNPSETNLL